MSHWGGPETTRETEHHSLRPDPLLRRRPWVVAHVGGLVLAVAGLGMLASALVEVIDGGPAGWALAGPGLGSLVVGTFLWRATTVPDRLRTATIFAAVLWSWVGLSVVGTLPFLLGGMFGDFWLALFESVSGFTTTGATVLRPIEGSSHGLLFWRAVTQWMGGIGVVVFAVSVLPFLGVGGMDLLEAEAPGPSSERLAPRVRETAKRLVGLYLGFTTLVATAYAIAGMNPYDAVSHSFTTVSTGGFNPYNSSFGHFGSATLEWIAIVAMFIAGGNFALYWRAIRGKPLVIFGSTEARAYAGLMLFIGGTAVAWNASSQDLSHDLVRQTLFSTFSLSTSTGYTILDYGQWAPAVQLALVFAMGLGGMAGSTTGGFKVFRLLAVLSYARRQWFRQLHPRSVGVIRFGRDVIGEEIVGRVVGFFGLFMAIGGIATFLVAASGTDPLTAISAVATSIGNVGPGLGEVGPTTDFLNIAGWGRGVLIVVMLVGRLEVFPVILGLVPLFRLIGRLLPARVASRLARIGSG